ncbi:MAG: acyl-CoA dehydrogenase family protein [Candidatus Dormibacteraeota bacterium]|nr:acyl-CoA dehydrogenase family protein [Candidatus Dormibacteraeota bacterium]
MTATRPARQRVALDVDDLYGIDELLTPDERLVRNTVRAFLGDRALPAIAEHFEQGTFPRELVGGLAELGLLGMHLHGYGCAGASAVAYGVACEELEACDSGLRSFVSVQGSLAMSAIHFFGSEAQKERFLPELAAGRAIGCFALTEPDAGSDPAVMRTRARRDDGDWVINGTKMWITNGSIADVAVVWAATDEGIRAFLVERSARDFSTRDIHDKLSLRASVTSELAFDSVRVSDEARLPEATSLGAALACLNEARYGIAWGAMGAARSCFDTALAYSRERHAFGKPIAAFQMTQQKLVDMATAIVQGRLMAHRLGTLKDAGGLHPVQVSVAKRANVRAALDVARTSRTILGANGLTLQYPVSRHMANLETVLTYEGTEEVHTLIVGRALTGLDAFS